MGGEGVHFNKPNRKFLVVLCLVFFPQQKKEQITIPYFMWNSLWWFALMDWYKYRTDRNSAFCSSVLHWKFNHCLCNTGATSLSFYFFNPCEFISYMPSSISLHMFTLLFVESVNYCLFFLTNFPSLFSHLHWKRLRSCENVFVSLSHLRHVIYSMWELLVSVPVFPVEYLSNYSVSSNSLLLLPEKF